MEGKEGRTGVFLPFFLPYLPFLPPHGQFQAEGLFIKLNLTEY